MTSSPIVRETELDGLKLIRRGKVRDIYDAGPDHLLIVATDRISAFDVILPGGIGDKGRILTALSVHWFKLLEPVVPNHLVSTQIGDFPKAAHPHGAVLEGRSMLVRRAEPLPVECIARGYITGSGLKDVRATGLVCGVELPRDIAEASRLDPPIFTPSTKAELGDHDENITYERAVGVVGEETAAWLRDKTLEVYAFARAHAEARGILVADTKMEFGRLPSGEIILIDEVLTADSSRFWPEDLYEPGQTQPSFDKQFVRDWLEATDWDKNSEPPALPDEIVAKTRAKYIEAYERLTEKKFAWV